MLLKVLLCEVFFRITCIIFIIGAHCRRKCIYHVKWAAVSKWNGSAMGCCGTKTIRNLSDHTTVIVNGSSSITTLCETIRAIYVNYPTRYTILVSCIYHLNSLENIFLYSGYHFLRLRLKRHCRGEVQWVCETVS